MKEMWKDIIGYKGLYQISNIGRVKSLERTVERIDQPPCPIHEKIISIEIINWGYGRVMLWKNNTRHKMFVHRLVGIHFIENEDNKPQINHKDGDKMNNCVDNLEWVTVSENITHAIKTGLNPRGKRK